MPKFTIGIPTYNRASFLRRSVESACDQTCDDVEVLVSDNASTDNSSEVARSFGDRVRYHRNGENIGMWRNFAQLTDMARGEYFSWLQDDDLIHSDFARRAIGAFEADRSIVMYSAYVMYAASPETCVRSQLYGPPVALDWLRPRLKVVDGLLVVPISFFTSFSVPPATAYRTDVIRRAMQDLDPENALYNERIVQSKAATEGKVALDPWPAAIFSRHENQGHVQSEYGDAHERALRWAGMARELVRMLEVRTAREWKPLLTEWLEGVDPLDCEYLLNSILPPAKYWSLAHPLAHEICSEILKRIPASSRVDPAPPAIVKTNYYHSAKELGRQLIPPLFWDLMRSARKAGVAARR